MFTQEALDEVIAKFYRSASRELVIQSLYLFGSYAKGISTEDSDIDLAVVSDDFQGIRFDDNKRLHKFTLSVSPYLETHPFRSEDFTPDNPFVAEILKTGKKIV